jgi:hypothetical protein
MKTLRAVCIRMSGLLRHRILGSVLPAASVPYSRAKTALRTSLTTCDAWLGCSVLGWWVERKRCEGCTGYPL